MIYIVVILDVVMKYIVVILDVVRLKDTVFDRILKELPFLY
jgi:hypothetical protein